MNAENDINATPAHTDQVMVSITDIKGWLKKGVTRRVGDPGYNAETGSVQEKYGMSKAEVTALFHDERLKGLKVSTTKPSRIIIAEDVVEPVEEATPSTEGEHIGASHTDDIPQSNGGGIPVNNGGAFEGVSGVSALNPEGVSMESPENEVLETQGSDNTAFEADPLEANF